MVWNKTVKSEIKYIVLLYNKYMKGTHIGGIIVLLLVAGAGIWGYSTFTTYVPKEYVVVASNGSSTMNTTTGITTRGVKSYTLVEIMAHKDASSCYSSINGSVYDLTAWINLHPGGKDRILSICGTDGTAKFVAQHQNGQKFLDILSRFKIGILSS
jgi:cytochrome b involved in lipid metabolism